MATIESKRLILRDYKESDLNDLHRLFSDKETMYYLDDIMTRTLDETAKSLQYSMANADGQYFCICDKSTGQFMGGIGYTITDTTPLGKIVHMGYSLLPEHHGHGYMTEAAKKVIEFAFTQDDCIRIPPAASKPMRPAARLWRRRDSAKRGRESKRSITMER